MGDAATELRWSISPRPLLRSPTRWVLACAWIILTWMGAEILRVTAGNNFHEIQPGQLYRSAQLSSVTLRSAIQKRGIRTIINLRNSCPMESWYQQETALCLELGVKHVDVNFSTVLPPSPGDLKTLVDAITTAPRPILIHCRRGADRTGLASAIALLVEEGIPLESARRQLSFRYGHVSLSKSGELGMVLDDYEDWLKQNMREHSSEALLNWINNAYCPGQCWAKIEPLEVPEKLRLGEAYLAIVKLTNLSHETWHFRRAANLGVHLRGYIQPEGSQPPPNSDKFAEPLERLRMVSGYTEKQVKPGENYVLEIALPVIHKAGIYDLYIDLMDEGLGIWFGHLGSQSISRKVEVVDDAFTKQ